MWCAALTGISPVITDELKKGKARTIELQSAHNIITLTGTKPGDYIFMTTVDQDDLCAGDKGMIVAVESITINMKRLVEYVHPSHVEERERMSARIKVRYATMAMIKEVQGQEWSIPTVVKFVHSSCYHAQ
jgi:hypothetical protein